MKHDDLITVYFEIDADEDVTLHGEYSHMELQAIAEMEHILASYMASKRICNEGHDAHGALICYFLAARQALPDLRAKLLSLVGGGDDIVYTYHGLTASAWGYCTRPGLDALVPLEDWPVKNDPIMDLWHSAPSTPEPPAFELQVGPDVVHWLGVNVGMRGRGGLSPGYVPAIDGQTPVTLERMRGAARDIEDSTGVRVETLDIYCSDDETRTERRVSYRRAADTLTWYEDGLPVRLETAGGVQDGRAALADSQ